MRVKFYLIKFTPESVTGHIRVSFSWLGNRLQFSTGESIDIQNWNTRRGKSDNYVLKGQPWHTHINQKLSDIKKFAGDLYYDFLNDEKLLTKEILSKQYKEKFIFYKKEEKPQGPRKLTVTDILKQALEFKKKTTRQRSFETYQSTFKHFDQFIKDNGLTERTTFDKYLCTDFENYLVNKFSSNSSINNNTQFFTTLLNQAVKINLISENPYRRTILTQEEGTHIAYNDEQAKQIIDYLEEKDLNLKRFCQFIYYSFARPIEIRRAKIGDINFDQKILFVSARGKNRTNRPVEILDPFMNVINEMNLKDYPKDYFIFTYQGKPGPKPVHKNHFNYNFRDRLNELGYDSKYTMYSFKHFGVIKHFLSGFDLRWLQDQTGHEDISNLMKYLRSLGMKINRANNLDVPVI